MCREGFFPLISERLLDNPMLTLAMNPTSLEKRVWGELLHWPLSAKIFFTDVFESQLNMRFLVLKRFNGTLCHLLRSSSLRERRICFALWCRITQQNLRTQILVCLML